MPRRNVMGAHDLSSGAIDFICLYRVVPTCYPHRKYLHPGSIECCRLIIGQPQGGAAVQRRAARSAGESMAICPAGASARRPVLSTATSEALCLKDQIEPIAVSYCRRGQAVERRRLDYPLHDPGWPFATHAHSREDRRARHDPNQTCRCRRAPRTLRQRAISAPAVVARPSVAKARFSQQRRKSRFS